MPCPVLKKTAPRFILMPAILIILMLALALPASAAEHTLDPGDSIAAAIDSAAAGDTIILNPGTYPESGIAVSKDIIIRANASAGGNAANTIIDGGMEAGIFSLQEYTTFTLTGVTLKDGAAADNGGGISAAAGNTVNVSAVVFSNCTALQWNGGAISIGSGSATISDSAFRNCTTNGTNGDGSAIFAESSTVHITSSSFTNCTRAWSGAIWARSSAFTITSSSFSGCAGYYGGAIKSGFGSTVNITGTSFSGCTADGNGGAIYASDSTWNIVSSSFTNCTAASNGGAIVIEDAGTTLSVSKATFSGCSAGEYGGGISAGYSGNATVSGSTFTGCSAQWGGAVYAGYSGGNVDITSSSITGCSAENGGSAIYSDSCTYTVRFSRIHGNTGMPVMNNGGSIDAANNWWGTNAGPAGFTSGGVTATPWLVLAATAKPSSITTAQTSVIRASLTNNSAGENTAGQGVVPGGIRITYARTSGTGSLAPTAGRIAAGINASRFTPGGAGTSTIAVKVDNQTVSLPVTAATDAPIANFSAGPRSGPAPLTVRFTDTSTRFPAAWKWLFGDGSAVNSTQKNPVHTYAQAGNYTVTLWVSNARGSNSTAKTAFISVKEPAPPVVTGILPGSGIRGRLVVITNISGTGFLAGANVSLNRTGYPLISATNVSVISAKMIRCTFSIPANAPLGLRNLVVRNSNGKSGMKAAAFTVKAPAAPTVSGIEPAAGQRGMLVNITNLSGTGFVGTPKPRIELLKNGSVITATNVSFVTGKKITCTFKIPAGAATGAWHARVTNGDGQSGVKNQAFTVTG